VAERTEELKRDIEQTRDHMTGTLDAIGDRVSPGRIVERRWERMRQSTSRLSTTVMGKPRAATARAGSSMESARDSAADAASTVADAVAGAPDRVKDAAAGSPLAAGAVAFGLGVLIGSLAPATPEEEQLAGHVIEPLQQELTDVGHELAGSVKEQVQEGVQQTKDAATQAAEQVKQQASDAAGTVTEKASDAKDEVTDQGKQAVDGVKS
jgi:ElaB/YqjD/DUF883 family membrane-anchored ribosome-binding protein